MVRIDQLASEEAPEILIEDLIVSEDLDKETKPEDLETESEEESPEMPMAREEYPETTSKAPIASQVEISMENS